MYQIMTEILKYKRTFVFVLVCHCSVIGRYKLSTIKRIEKGQPRLKRKRISNLMKKLIKKIYFICITQSADCGDVSGQDYTVVHNKMGFF